MKPWTCFELVGPPGAGKTTLARELGTRMPRIRLTHPPDWKKPRNIPFFVKNCLAVAPVVASISVGKRGRRPCRKEFFWLVFLNGWHRLLRRRGTGRDVVMLDQGPVYMLSGMIWYRAGQMGGRLLGRWWRKQLKNWGPVVEGIVRLDASDEVLADRINTREQDHLVKDAPESRIHEFLDQSREILDRTVGQLSAGQGFPEVLRFDTGEQALDEIVDGVAPMCDSGGMREAGLEHTGTKPRPGGDRVQDRVA